jgi:hypothetical protein
MFLRFVIPFVQVSEESDCIQVRICLTSLTKRTPRNVRCKAPHLIKIILAYSPKKKRADPIEDESEGGSYSK